jgi:molecular chaperone DnaK
VNVNSYEIISSSVTSTSSASPPAPKGVRQIEITFDIDAGELLRPFAVQHSRTDMLDLVDGIMNISAKDKATNKDQSTTIPSSSGLNNKDIEKMVPDTEQYAESDKARKNLIEEANKADSVCSDTEKGMFMPKYCLSASDVNYIYI